MGDGIPKRIGDLTLARRFLKEAQDAPAFHHKAEKAQKAYQAIEEWAEMNDVSLEQSH